MLDRLVFRRASQDVLCDVCGRIYGRHEQYLLFPWLNIICNGELIKL